jgi:transposase
MSKVKALSFEGETIYCGIDSHKSNWKLNIRTEEVELRNFSQNPDPDLLSEYLNRNYPKAKFKAVYEAGFSGFGIQRSLSALGIECIVVNASDVPTSDKERKRKDDKVDARKLSRQLAEGNLRGIYIPDIAMEHARVLVRQRWRLVQDQTRCKNRIKHLLMCNGIKVEAKGSWSRKYVRALEMVNCSEPLKVALNLAVGEYKQIRCLLKEALVAIQQLSKQQPFVQVQKYLQSVDGIGLINGMVIQTEIQDIKRFKILDTLCSYAGFVPDIRSSDERTVVKGITNRCNSFLREAIIESSWMLIRKDPAMLMKYKEYCRRMNTNKAIVRIAKHLLSRIRYVWTNQTEYQKAIVG